MCGCEVFFADERSLTWPRCPRVRNGDRLHAGLQRPLAIWNFAPKDGVSSVWKPRVKRHLKCSKALKGGSAGTNDTHRLDRQWWFLVIGWLTYFSSLGHRDLCGPPPHHLLCILVILIEPKLISFFAVHYVHKDLVGYDKAILPGSSEIVLMWKRATYPSSFWTHVCS